MSVRISLGETPYIRCTCVNTDYGENGTGGYSTADMVAVMGLMALHVTFQLDVEMLRILALFHSFHLSIGSSGSGSAMRAHPSVVRVTLK